MWLEKRKYGRGKQVMLFFFFHFNSVVKWCTFPTKKHCNTIILSSLQPLCSTHPLQKCATQKPGWELHHGM